MTHPTVTAPGYAPAADRPSPAAPTGAPPTGAPPVALPRGGVDWLLMAAVLAVAAALVQRFDMRPAKGYDLASWETSLVDVYITLRGTLPAVLTPRQPAQ